MQVGEQVWSQVPWPGAQSMWQLAVQGDRAILSVGGSGLTELDPKKCQLYCTVFRILDTNGTSF